MSTEPSGTRPFLTFWPHNQSFQHSHYLRYGDRSGPLTVDENGGPSAPESIGFMGERGDPDTNLLYLNARWYDPVLGRFPTPDWWDPNIPGVGANHYAYAGNDPVNLGDRSGQVAPVTVLAGVAVFRAGWASDGGAPMTSSCAWTWLMAVQR